MPRNRVALGEREYSVITMRKPAGSGHAGVLALPLMLVHVQDGDIVLGSLHTLCSGLKRSETDQKSILPFSVKFVPSCLMCKIKRKAVNES